MPNEKLKVIISYSIATVILSIYGGEVCPFLERLTLIDLGIIIAFAFTVGFFIRDIVFSYYYRKVETKSSTEIYATLWVYLLVDNAVWILVGFLVTFFNLLFYEFPLASGLKIVLGCATIGFFSATYFALSYERVVILASASKNEPTAYESGKFFSISTKFLILLCVSYFVMAAIILLMIYHDFIYIADNIQSAPATVFRAVATEILFVFTIIFGGSLFIAKQYGRNLKLMFQLQLKTLDEVSGGNYDTQVPVVSSDEFGLIANHSNRMIGGLKEKERIRSVFGKYLSPSVVASVLENEEGAKLGGRMVNVAILFADIRNYSTLSEKLDPAETVWLLNNYFTLSVQAIYASNGVVDKFIGDAVMAIYGLDDAADACDRALNSALKMIASLENFNTEIKARGMSDLSIGIGIHFGPVIAGNIGSKERLEYTVIGDAVNTASRLETLSKEVSSTVVLSKDVIERLSPVMQSKVSSLGEFELKGKSEKVRVYGLV